MFLKKILPVENYTIVTPLSKEEVYRRLALNIEPRKSYRFWSGPSAKEFEGEFSPDRFSIQRVIGYRNSFLPQITGTIISVQQKTHVHIKMQPDILVTIFMICWLFATGMLSGAILLQQLRHFAADKFTFIPVAMFLFGCLLINFGFKPESSISKKFLNKLLLAEPGV